MSDEIAKAAAKLHEREAAEVKSAHRGEELAAIRARGEGYAKLMKQREVLRRTLAPPMSDRWLATITTLALIAAGASVVSVPKRIAFPVILAAAVVFMVVVFTLPRVIPILVANARNARLATLGFGIDADAYRALLSQNRRQARVVMTCTFDPPIDQSRRAEYADALRGWVREFETATWEGDALVAKTGELSGRIMLHGRYAAGKLFSNQALHAVVLKTLSHLPALHADRVAIDFAGELEPWDARS